jgi:hypothetical protein
VPCLQGFYCKPAALLATEHDLVALVDLDAVLMDNPFALTRTAIFRYTGSYLFSDRRLHKLNFKGQVAKHRLPEDWAAMLEGLWHRYGRLAA